MRCGGSVVESSGLTLSCPEDCTSLAFWPATASRAQAHAAFAAFDIYFAAVRGRAQMFRKRTGQ